MRLAPVPMFFAAHDTADPVAMCAASSVTTHGAPVAIDACRYFGALLVGALNGASKEALVVVDERQDRLDEPANDGDQQAHE